MFTIGILCSRRKLAQVLEQTISLLAARAGMDYIVKNIHMRNHSSQEWDEFSCLILSLEDMEQAFIQAEQIWMDAPSLPVIYVAHSVEELSASLQQPFFHTVRIYDLEQDLGAALRKLGRLKLPTAEKISFNGSKGILLVRRNAILYLESQHHDIQLHMEAARFTERSAPLYQHYRNAKNGSGAVPDKDVFPARNAANGKEVVSVNETLAQCEEKLKSSGFVRIHRSFLVNMYHIRRMDKDSVILDNGETLYISRHRYTEVKLRFENYIRHLEFL